MPDTDVSESIKRAVWKYGLEVTDRQGIEMPEGAVILSVAVQAGTICLWALVDPWQPVSVRQILIAGTGHAREDIGTAAFLGSVLMHDDRLVFHVFEELYS